MERDERIKVELTVNSKRVGLNQYVNGVFQKVIFALVDTLKGVDDPQEIVITLKKRN